MSTRTMSAKKVDENGEVDLTAEFSAQMSQLCMNAEHADIEFLVENTKLPAHKTILAARSAYFRALFYGGLAESTQSEIKLTVPLEAFKALLGFIYNGRISLASLREECLLDTLGLANQYGFESLELSISTYLTYNLSLENCCAILDAAGLYSLEWLRSVCMTFMDRNALSLLKHSTFQTLSQDSLCSLLERDSFFAPEVEIFNSVHEWCKCNPRADIEGVVSFVRFSLMDLDQLLKIVRPSTILDPEHLLDAIEEKSTSNNLKHRGALWPKKNLATAEYKSKTICGDLKSSLLDGDISNYDMEKGYTRHSITDANDQSIIVELGTISIINHIKMLLWDRDQRSYSYFVEVSVDQKNWDRVIDHTQYHCRSWQFLYFQSCAVRFIKVVGTHNTSNRLFHLVAFETYFNPSIPKLMDGLISPRYNVATVAQGAIVLEGVSRTRNALLNGDVKNYDWDSGYTCHQLGSGSIVIQLGQPYHISSMRMLLWDCDTRTYSFYIETSTNQTDWKIAVDKRDEQLRSWQQFSFESRPVVFIRIIGMHNTANEIFHCVHFECPSQDIATLSAAVATDHSQDTSNSLVESTALPTATVTASTPTPPTTPTT